MSTYASRDLGQRPPRVQALDFKHEPSHLSDSERLELRDQHAAGSGTAGKRVLTV